MKEKHWVKIGNQWQGGHDRELTNITLPKNHQLAKGDMYTGFHFSYVLIKKAHDGKQMNYYWERKEAKGRYGVFKKNKNKKKA